MLDLSQQKDAHVNKRLQNEKMIWLSTVRPNGRPHLVPVWFFWDGTTILIFSQPNAQKVRDIRHNSSVMLALDTAQEGDDVVLIEGDAVLLDPASVNATQSAYTQKYESWMQRMGSNAEALAKEYSQPIRVIPTKFISWNE
ncbi:MAG TPA: TIGR03667 family PPOX class F420-dependent oxidoreductase [Ktedonobacteraceae bacterium]|nr:TIGR03667 family PPOX class F420-dependent oxidoreductase [Ktedonobacteraceae bacterium]